MAERLHKQLEPSLVALVTSEDWEKALAVTARCRGYSDRSGLLDNGLSSRISGCRVGRADSCALGVDERQHPDPDAEHVFEYDWAMTDGTAILHLGRQWTLGREIGSGGFGRVFEASSYGDTAVAKLVPKAPGADRELLFVDLAEAVNVVPIIDSGEHEESWVLVMPRADRSLRDHLAEQGQLDIASALAILGDTVDALLSLDGRVVHRDLKPENILYLDGKWCLADFGISRYAEATTAPDTHKYAMSAPYAAPERWRHERATTATDIYSIGVVAFEMISGHRPFPGPGWEDYQQQHLHDNPPPLEGVSARTNAAIEECLFKSPGARPSPANLRARFDSALGGEASGGLAALSEANRDEVARRSERERQDSARRSESEARSGLADAGRSLFERVSTELVSAIVEAAPAAQQSGNPRSGGRRLTLGQGTLTITQPKEHPRGDWGGWDPPKFDVILSAEVNLRIPPNRSEYEGRGHALWYCDAEKEGEFAWYETAFMISALIPRRGRQNPFALTPGEESAKALWTGIAELQIAWPFARLIAGEMEEFIDRWAGWFGLASQGRLGHPHQMPETPGSEHSFRRS